MAKKKVVRKKYAGGGDVSIFDYIDPPVLTVPRTDAERLADMERYKLLRASDVRGSGVRSDYKPLVLDTEQQRLEDMENYKNLRALAKRGVGVKTGYTADKRTEQQAMSDYTTERKKYALGSPVPEDPSMAITRNQIAKAKAAQTAANDPTAKGLNMFGNLAMSVGQQMMQKGISEGGGADGKGIAGFLNKNQGFMNTMFGAMQGIGAGASFALGGVAKTKRTKFATGGVPINAEGGEVVEVPGGEPVELDGASHANGGINMEVPAGTEIYSQQLKGPDGKTMATRKKARESKEARISRSLKDAPSDKLLRNAFKRTKQGNAVVDAQDMNKMKIAQMITQMGEAYAMGGTVQKYNLGGEAYEEDFIDPPTTGYGTDGRFIKPPVDADPSEIPDYTGYGSNNRFLKPTVSADYLDIPTASAIDSDIQSYNNSTAASNAKEGAPMKFGLGDIFGNVTAGDALGLYGQYKASTDPLKNTRAQRASDTPNINAFKDYGKRGLNELDKSKGYLEGQRASALGNLNLDRIAAASRNRAGARGINTLRSLDIATDVQAQKAKESVNNQFNSMMADIFSKASGMMNQQDQMVMQGEQGRDAADRADKDAYYSAMARDIATKNTGMQYMGKNINEMKTRKVTNTLMNKLYPNFQVDGMSGDVTKGGTTVAKAGTWELVDGVLRDKKTKKEIKDTE